MKDTKGNRYKIAVIQLLRIGDIIMSLPLLEALAKKHRNADIYFFINGMYADLLPVSPFFKCVPIHFNDLYGALNDADTIQAADRLIEDELGDYFRIRFDQVINLSSQRLSAILAALFRAEERLGLVLSRDDSLIHMDPNLALFSEIRTGRNINWVHQLEIYLSSVCGAKPDPLGVTGKSLFPDPLGAGLEEPLVDGRYVMISPGASLPQKELGAAVLESLCRSILARTDYQIVLSGTGNEVLRHKTLQIPDSSRVIDYAGKTEHFRDLWNLIHHAECLICNDSGPMHMAALLNKKTVVFSVGSAFFPETMAYNPDILFLVPSSDCYPCPWIGFQCGKQTICKKSFDRDQIAKQVLAYLRDETPAARDSAGSGYRTLLKESGLIFLPQGGKKQSIVEYCGIVYQTFWKEKLLEMDAGAALAFLLDRYRFDETLLRNDIQAIDGDLNRFSAFLDQILRWFLEFKHQNNPHLLDRIKSGIDTIFSVSDQETFLTPLLQHYKIIFHSIVSDNPVEIISEYHRISMAMQQDLNRLRSLLVSAVKPSECHAVPERHREAVS